MATYEEGGTMMLHVSRDDGRTFLPAVFPGRLDETRYTIMDQDDGTVFVSVEHKQPSAGEGACVRALMACVISSISIRGVL